MGVGRALLRGTGMAGMAGMAATAGWMVLARAQGDSEMGFGPCTVLDVGEGGVTAEVEIVNRGREAGVIRRVDGHVAEGPPARVLVTRRDSRPQQRGWWVSNILRAGETCMADIEVELSEPAPGPVIVELDLHEIGRRLLVHRKIRVTLPTGAAAS